MTIRNRIAVADQILLGRVAVAGRPGLDRVMHGIGRAADNGALWIAVAALVAASRVATRVHYPSDVVAGLALGTAAGLVTLRWWPRRLDEPAAAVRPHRQAPASPSGSGLVLIVNCSAGTASAALAESLGASLPEAEIIVATADDDMDSLFRKAAARSRILEPISPNWRWQWLHAQRSAQARACGNPRAGRPTAGPWPGWPGPA